MSGVCGGWAHRTSVGHVDHKWGAKPYRRGVSAAYIHPDKPWENGFAESFISRLRDEYLDEEALLTVLDAPVKLSLYRRYWNEERLHSRLGYQTPSEFADKWRADREGKKGINASSKSGEAKDPVGA